MDREQIVTELSELVEKRVAEKSPQQLASFNGRSWVEQWMKIPNIGLGHNTPEAVMLEDPERVRQYLQRIEIVPFKKPWSF